jgi:hypothetical protein
MQRDQEGGVSLPIRDVDSNVPPNLHWVSRFSPDGVGDLKHTTRRNASLKPLGTLSACQFSDNIIHLLSETVVSVAHGNSA